MADTVDTLVAEVQTIVDVTAAQALTALNRRHRTMVKRSKCLRQTVELGPTVAGQDFYAAPSLVQVYGVSVNGAPYVPGRRGDVYAGSQGTLVLCGPGGVYVRDDVSLGVPGLRFVPAPSEAGQSISVYAAVAPADLLAGGAISTVKVEEDYFDALIEAAAATFLRRIGEGDPNTDDPMFDAKCEELRIETMRKYSSGPRQIRIAGINA